MPKAKSKTQRQHIAAAPEIIGPAENSAKAVDPVANLRPFQFKPGQSGNPAGRPRLFTNLIIEQGKKKIPGDPKGRTYAEMLVEQMYMKAFKGDVQAAREIIERTEGKVPFTIPMPQDGNPLIGQGEDVLDRVVMVYVGRRQTELGSAPADAVRATAEAGSPSGQG